MKATYTPSRAVKRERLSLEQFLAIREVAPTWLKNAMNLALVTAQRRDDLVTMKFSAYNDGRLNIEQGKTGTKLSLSGDIRLDVVGLSIGEVFAACRDAVVSRYVIHHTRPVSTARPGDPVGANGLSNGFKRARDSLNITPSEGRTPPSFHEIRSLAERLYKAERGAEFAQAILGHKHASMTAVYDDMRGQGWAQIG